MAAGRIGELVIVLIAAAVLRHGLLPHGADGRLLLAAPGAGVMNVVATSATWPPPGPACSAWPW